MMMVMEYLKFLSLLHEVDKAVKLLGAKERFVKDILEMLNDPVSPGFMDRDEDRLNS